MTVWREVWHALASMDEIPYASLQDQLAVEAHCLARVILPMNATAESLHVPMETTPFAAMAALPWPRLRSLSVHGRYLDNAQTNLLRPVLSCLPELRHLSIMVAKRGAGRAPILGHQSTAQSQWQLESLQLAYPDIDDAIFSIDTSRLTILTLRDWPRYYHDLGWLGSGFSRPILTATECLHILKRMSLPRLSRMELVYIVHTADEDDELLKHLVIALPQLEHLALRRYRADRAALVDYVSTTSLLRSVSCSLDSLRQYPGAYPPHIDRPPPSADRAPQPRLPRRVSAVRSVYV